MSKQKSFNIDEAAHLKRCVASGAIIGAMIALVLLPAIWRWLRVWIVGTAVTLASFGTAMAPELPEAMLQNPLEVLPELIQDDAFLVGCVATLAISTIAGVWSHFDWSRWLHDGTWVGGRHVGSGRDREERQAHRLGPRLYPRRKRRGQEQARRHFVSLGKLRARPFPHHQRH